MFCAWISIDIASKNRLNRRRTRSFFKGKVNNYNEGSLIFVHMANRLKSKKGQGPASGKLKPEKETRVTARQIAKDERTHKITGAVFLLLAIFLFLEWCPIRGLSLIP